MIPYQTVYNEVLSLRIGLQDDRSGIIVPKPQVLRTGGNGRVQSERKIVNRHAVGMPFQNCKSCILHRVVDGGGYLADPAANGGNGSSVQIGSGRFIAVCCGTGLNGVTDGNLLSGHNNQVVQMSGCDLYVIDPVGGTGGKTGGTGTCQYKIRTVGQGSFHHNRGQIAVGQLQRERLRRSGGELLLKRGQNPHLHVVIQLIIGLSGIQNIASRTRIKNRGIALKYLTFQLLIDGGQENVDHGAVADHTLPDSAVIGKKNRVIAQKI